MADIERSIDVAAHPEDVFRFVVSQWEGSLDFWAGGIENWKPLTPPPLGEGSRVRYTGRMLGIGMPVTMEVRDYRPGRGWTAYSLGSPAVRGDWRFEKGPSGTRFTYRLRYTMPPPLLGPLLDRLILARQWGKAIDASLARLKARMER